MAVGGCLSGICLLVNSQGVAVVEAGGTRGDKEGRKLVMLG